MKKHYWVGRFLTVSIILAVILINLPFLSAALLANLALVRMLKAPSCDPDWFVCQNLPTSYPPLKFSGNENPMQQAQNWFEQALRLQPGSERIRLRLAETAFALGERERAAAYISELDEPDPRSSVLLQADRYEARLVQADRAFDNGALEEAVRDYRLGLAWGDERTLPQDEADYFMALARLEQEKVAQNPQDVQARYRIGRYLARAGQWEQALSWLSPAEALNQLPPRQAAWAYLTIGQYREDQGDQEGAIAAYRRALGDDPGLRQASVQLLSLLRFTGQEALAEKISQSLIAQGPSYPLGAIGEGYQDYQPAELPGGWTLVGYDLDEEMLEQGKSLELLLWWRSAGQEPSGAGWIKVGEYWLQRQQMKNLFPDAGFEWGENEAGVPLGHVKELYDAPEGSLFVEAAERQGQATRVLVTNNSPDVNHVALVSRRMPVDQSGLYLMAGWIRDRIGLATLGRSCSGHAFNAPSPYYIVEYQSGRPVDAWLHHAQVSAPYPGQPLNQCELLVMNDANADQPADWDNILFTRITSPN